MPFPNAEDAIVPEEKVREYLLNMSHPVGRPKAIWFASLGYTQNNWRQLADDLLKVARTTDGFSTKLSPFGIKYEVSGEIGRPNHRPAIVVSVWIVENSAPPRLVTAYPG